MPYTDPEMRRRRDAERYASRREEIRAQQATHRARLRGGGSRACQRGGCVADISLRHRNARYCSSDCRKIAIAVTRTTEPYLIGARARNSRYKAAYPEKAVKYEAARRARKTGAFVEYVDPDVVWARDEGICHICQRPADPDNWHLEHVIPLARGGAHSYANTAVSHPRCNLRKGTR